MKKSNTGKKQKNYKSIADCKICNRIPQKTYEYLSDTEKLLTITQDGSTDRDDTSTTKLLKCPTCGTHYFYNHDYTARNICEPEINGFFLKRYDVLTAREFLKCFVADHVDLPASEIAKTELEEIEKRYDEIMQDLIEIIKNKSPHWEIRMHAIESLCDHFLSQQNWDTMSNLLLKHPDPLVRLSTARFLFFTAIGNLSSYDVAYGRKAFRKLVEEETSKKAHREELIQVLLEVALTNDIRTFKDAKTFKKGIRESFPNAKSLDLSKYRQADSRDYALEILAIAAHHQANLTQAIPALIGLFSKGQWLYGYVCRVLQELAQEKQNAKIILEEMKKIDQSKIPNLFEYSEYKTLVQQCEKLLGLNAKI